MAIVNYAESWKDIYDKYKSEVNFVAGDFDSLKDVIRRYIVMQNPENYNDWAESSEVGMFANGLAYLGESLHYRVDLNAHDNFPMTTERRQSLLNFTKLLSYSPKRNICATGIAKVKSISTTQYIQDTSGNILKDVTISWNDPSNPDWLEQFLTVMNSSLSLNNPFGKPLKKDVVDDVTTQLYELNNIANNNAVYSFTSLVNTSTQKFEVVNADINTSLNYIYEKTPTPESAFHILYRNDGSGNASKNTGFFVYWKQGSLSNELFNFTNKIENNSYELTTKNINEYDVWVQELDATTGLVKNNWTKIANDEYLVYNNTDNQIRNIFKVETREDDTAIIRFSDGKFGNIPVGIFRFWYRTSQGNSNLYIKPSNMKNITVRIPYRSNNTSDDNIYYLTLTFSVEDISHIRQSVANESMNYIRERAPQVYSTQNRMVTGQDYNYFPKSYGQRLKVVKAIERTYAGNSRYIKFNDPSGSYQDLSLLAEDGYLYKTNNLSEIEVPTDTTTTARNMIVKNILPILNNPSVYNLYYDKYQEEDIWFNPTIGNRMRMTWKETYAEGSNTSYGVLLNEVNSDKAVVPYSYIQNMFYNGSMLKFVEKDAKKSENELAIIWAKVLDFNVNALDNNSYTIAINEVLDDNKEWELQGAYMPFITSFNSQTFTDIESKIDNKISFGLIYDDNARSWNVINGELLADNKVEMDYNSPLTEYGKYKNWIIKINYESPNLWNITSKSLDYVFGSESKIAFFFNTNEKYNNSFSTRDYLKVLQINTKNNTNELYREDYYWKPAETIRYSDGYTDTRKVKVYGYDFDKDSSVDNPTQFKTMIGQNIKKLYFMRTDDGLDAFDSSVTEVTNMWGLTKTSGTYFCTNPGIIYKAGTKMPYNITIKVTDTQKGITLSNGVKLYHDQEIMKDEIVDYDVIDEGYNVVYNEAIKDYERVPVSNKLVKWNASKQDMTWYNDDEWYTKEGIDKLKFIWQHYASSSYVIDPCPTNIIDIYALTNTYYDEVQTWLKNNKQGIFPKLPTAYELKSMFTDLENYNMISDTIVWHPIKYKLLFGNEAENEFKANFRVIKNSNTTASDNEIKQQVINYIDEYFASMEAGEKFYFTQLSTYVHQKLNSMIDTIVIVPSYSDDKFGNLFEIVCDEEEILLSSATIDNVQVISKITNNNIKIGE